MRFVKIVLVTGLVLGLVILAGVSILAVSGGSNDNLRKGLEQFFMDYTGRVATIETLGDAQFYPELVMAVRGVALRRTANDAEPQIRIDALQVRMRFWDAIFSRGRFSAFSFEGMRFAAGEIAPGALTIDTAGIEGEGPAAVFHGRGIYNGAPFEFSASLIAEGAAGGWLYRLGESSAATLALGDLQASARLAPIEGRSGVTIADLVVAEKKTGGRALVDGSGSVSAQEGVQIVSRGAAPAFTLALRFMPGAETDAAGGAVLVPHADAQEGFVGHILFPAPAAADFAPGGRVAVLASALRSLLVPQDKPAERLAGLGGRIGILAGPGRVDGGPFGGDFQCAAAQARVAGSAVTIDPVWVLREGADIGGAARYDLVAGGLSGGPGPVADRQALNGFAEAFGSDLRGCTDALRRWMAAGAGP